MPLRHQTHVINVFWIRMFTSPQYWQLMSTVMNFFLLVKTKWPEFLAKFDCFYTHRHTHRHIKTRIFLTKIAIHLTHMHTHMHKHKYIVYTHKYTHMFLLFNWLPELLALTEPKTSTHVFIREELVVLRNTVNSFVPASLSDKEALIGRAFGGPRRCHRRAWRPLALPSAS